MVKETDKPSTPEEDVTTDTDIHMAGVDTPVETAARRKPSHTYAALANNPPPVVSGTSGWIKFMAVFAFIIALLAIIGLGLGWKRFMHLQSASVADVRQIQNELQQSQAQLRQLTQDLATAQSQVQAQGASLSKQQDILERIAQKALSNDATWVLNETQYLVRLAMLNLQFSRDISTAITLLQTADQRLTSLDDTSLLEVRQSLANAIVALRALPNIDLEGLLAKLTALSGQVDQLPLMSVKLPDETNNTASEHPIVENLEKGWRQALHATWETLQKLIIIRRNDEPITPLLAPNQRFYLQQNLRIMLQNAQWAVLHGNAAVYQSNLQQAMDWIKRYFANNVTATQGMLTALDELLKINIQPKVPDLNPTLDIIKKVAAQRTDKTLLEQQHAPERQAPVTKSSSINSKDGANKS